MKELIVSVASVLLALVIGSSIIGLKASSDKLVTKVSTGLSSYADTIDAVNLSSVPAQAGEQGEVH